MDSVFEDVKSVIMDVLKIDGSNITPETRFIEDLKADSKRLHFLFIFLSSDVPFSAQESAALPRILPPPITQLSSS